LVGELVERKGRNGTTFYGCNQFPVCSHTQQTAPALSKVMRTTVS
jgi:DNA helicase-4